MIRSLVAVAFLLLAAGCATRVPVVDWVEPFHSRQAAFLWNHAGGTLTGDAVITSDISGNVAIRLNKNLPKPLLETLSTRDGRFEASGPMASGGWSGRSERVPVRFSLWQALAEAWRGAVPARDGRQEVHTATYRAAVWKENGRIRELSVSSTDNGEMVRLVFR